MFNFLREKLVEVITTIVAILTPGVSPAPSPVPETTSSPTPIVSVGLGLPIESILPTPTPTDSPSPVLSPSATPDISKLVDDLNKIKEELIAATPEPTLIPQPDLCRNIPYAQSVLPNGYYRTVDNDCFPKLVETPSPVPTPLLATPTPTPLVTPTPMPTPVPETFTFKGNIFNNQTNSGQKLTKIIIKMAKKDDADLMNDLVIRISEINKSGDYEWQFIISGDDWVRDNPTTIGYSVVLDFPSIGVPSGSYRQLDIGKLYATNYSGPLAVWVDSVYLESGLKVLYQ